MNGRAVVIGGSAGALEALDTILPGLAGNLAVPVLIAQHLHPSDGGAFARQLALSAGVPVVEPCDKLPIEPGHVYTAPADYHMLIEPNETISLSVDERVNWSRPSIDVLFESAALVWRERLVAVILSGANTDGTLGIRKIKAYGGYAIAQLPQSAKSATMPQAAINAGVIDEVQAPQEIAARLRALQFRVEKH